MGRATSPTRFATSCSTSSTPTTARRAPTWRCCCVGSAATLGMDAPGRPLGAAAPVATSATLGAGIGPADVLREFADKVFGVRLRVRSRSSARPARPSKRRARPRLSRCRSRTSTSWRRSATTSMRSQRRSAGESSSTVNRPTSSIPAMSSSSAIVCSPTRSPGPCSQLSASELGRGPTPSPRSSHAAPTGGGAALRNPAAVEQALGRYLWLLSLARRRQGDRLTLPLFAVEVQLWVREVSRLLRAVDADPSFRWLDSAADRPRTTTSRWLVRTSLPASTAAAAGSSGWMAVQSELGRHAADIARRPIYQAGPQPIADRSGADPRQPRRSGASGTSRQRAGSVGADRGRGAGARHAGRGRRQGRIAARRVDERDAIRFLGLQVASLASVAINTLFGSPHVDETSASCSPSPTRCRTPRTGPRSSPDARTASTCAAMASVVAAATATSSAGTTSAMSSSPRPTSDRRAVRARAARPARASDGPHGVDRRPGRRGLEVLRSRGRVRGRPRVRPAGPVGRTLELSRAAVAGVRLDDFDHARRPRRRGPARPARPSTSP